MLERGFARAAVVVMISGMLLAAAITAAAAQSPELRRRSEQGALAMSEGRFEEAIRIYREILASLPDEPGILMNLGMSLAMSGREKEAIDPLRRAVALRPSLVPAQLFLGTSHLALGEPDKAIGPLTKVVAANPSDVDARDMLGQAHLAAGRPSDAVQQFRRLTELSPRTPAAWFGLGRAYTALSQQALDTFQNEPEDSPWRQITIADALAVEGRSADAFTLYRRAAERLPPMPSLHDSIAAIYERTGHADWAATERARAGRIAIDCVKRKPHCEFRAGRLRSALSAAGAAADPESRYWRARVATDLAHAAFSRLEDLPDSRERRAFRTEVARAQGRHADAVKEIEAALVLSPGEPDLLIELARSHYALRDYERAASVAGALLEKTPGVPGLLALRGEALLQLQRLDEAVPLLERAVQADPRDPSARASLGRALVQQAQFARAIPLLEPLLGSDADGSLHLQLARAYQASGQRDRAAPLLDKARSLQQAAETRAAGATEATITPPS
jgi:tetratricopeptide (TPR) repeat protein